VSAAGWGWGAPPLLALAKLPLDLQTWAVTTAIAGGAGLLPDCDHEHGTIAHSFGPPTRVLARIIKRVFGGHRRGAHSIVFCLAVGSVVSALAGAWPAWTLGITLGICGAWFGRTQARGHHNRTEVMGAAIVAGAVVPQLLTVGLLIGLAVGAGALLHLVGDWLMDDGGVPLFWPFSKRKFSLSNLPGIGFLALEPECEERDRSGRVVSRSGGRGERIVAWACRLAIPAAAVWWYWWPRK
jgi:membrane-bound metal-dependent hydrolase YbcI (DUF457 family)